MTVRRGEDMDPDTADVPEDRCPVCGARSVCVQGLTTMGTPKSGDFSLCSTCGSVSRFGPQLDRRPVGADELERDEHAELRKLQIFVRLHILMRNLRGRRS